MRSIVLVISTLLLLGSTSSGGAVTPGTVSVVYAGSLVTPMEGPITASLLLHTGLHFSGEARGSKALANLILAGLRKPDVFISADRSDVTRLARAGLVASQTTFASATMVLGYSNASPDRALFARVAAGHASLLSALQTPGLRIARTDPKLDPKGERTLTAMRILAGPALASKILGSDRNPSQIFPEEDLLVRLETGEADVGFLYSIEAIARHIPAIALPGKASLRNQITYTLAVLKRAPHPLAARRFAAFLLDGEGRHILTAAGMTYFRRR